MKSLTQYGRFGLSLVAFVLLLTISLVLNPYLPYHWQYSLSFLLVFPAIWVGVELTRCVARLDELQQRLLLEAFAFGLANTALFAFAVGLLQPAFHWEINLAWILPIAALCTGIGFLIARRRYR